MTGMVLNDADLQTPCWRKLEKHLQDKLATLRAENDSLLLSNDETQQKRGRIADVKELLALGVRDRTLIGLVPFQPKTGE